jgi:hypothetical protein
MPSRSSNADAEPSTKAGDHSLHGVRASDPRNHTAAHARITDRSLTLMRVTSRHERYGRFGTAAEPYILARIAALVASAEQCVASPQEDDLCPVIPCLLHGGMQRRHGGTYVASSLLRPSYSGTSKKADPSIWLTRYCAAHFRLVRLSAMRSKLVLGIAESHLAPRSSDGLRRKKPELVKGEKGDDYLCTIG